MIVYAIVIDFGTVQRQELNTCTHIQIVDITHARHLSIGGRARLHVAELREPSAEVPSRAEPRAAD